MAVINKNALLNDVRNIIGDKQNQFYTELELELVQVCQKLTVDYAFYWNTAYAEPLTHTNGIIQLPDSTGKILGLFDSDGNTNYFDTEPNPFYLARKNFGNQLLSVYSNEQFPFLRSISDSGNEQLLLHSGTSTSSTRTYSLVYTRIARDLAIYVPDRLYNYFVGMMSYRMLARTSNMDNELVKFYLALGMECLTDELHFSQNGAYISQNTKPMSEHFMVNTMSNPI